MTRVWVGLLLAAWATIGAGQEAPPAAGPRQVVLYGPTVPGAELAHALIKGRYQLSYRLHGILTMPAEPAGQGKGKGKGKGGKRKPPTAAVEARVPEAGQLTRPVVEPGLLLDVTAKTGEGRVSVAIEHRAYRPPEPDVIAAARPRSRELKALSDALIAGSWPRARAGRVRAMFASLLRGSRASFARDVLHAFCLAYADPEGARAVHKTAVWTYLARLLKVETKGTPDALYARIRLAICGYQVRGRFTPTHHAVPQRAPRVMVRGVIGKAVLVGQVGGAAPVDWWALELADREAPIDAQGTTAGLHAVRVLDRRSRRVYLRVFAAGATVRPYRYVVRNKHGNELDWIEVHELPPPDDTLPY